MAIDLIGTIRGSLLEGFFPEGWDLGKFDEICSRAPDQLTRREPWWNRRFEPVPCATLADFDTYMGH